MIDVYKPLSDQSPHAFISDQKVVLPKPSVRGYFLPESPSRIRHRMICLVKHTMTELCGSGLEQNDFYSLRLKFTVRRHKFNKILPLCTPRYQQGGWWPRTETRNDWWMRDGNTQQLVDAGRRDATIGGRGWRADGST